MKISVSKLFKKKWLLLIACWGLTLCSFNGHAKDNEALEKSPRLEEKKNTDQGNNEVLAKIQDGQVITVADILSEVNKMQVGLRPDFFKRPENIHQVVNNLLVRRELARQAQLEKLDEDQVVQAALNVAKDRVLSDARLNKMDRENEPSETAMQAYALSFYKANLEKYEVPAQTRASHILIEGNDEQARKQAEDLIAKIKTGSKFEDVAKEYSKDPGSALRGGDLGFFAAGRMVKPFEDALNQLTQLGDISAPVASQFGFHIIRLDERKAKSIQSYEEVKNKLLSEARGGILSEKRMLMVQKINSQIQFDRDAIVKLSKEASEKITTN